jgi:rare lipoprotein A
MALWKSRGAAVLLCTVLLLAACGGKKHARVSVPPPPAIESTATAGPPQESTTSNPRVAPGPADSAEEESVPAASVDIFPTFAPDAKPLAVETGTASWYGPPYHNRRGSNGQLYNMHALTAAHRTLPLGTVARVTNLTTGHSTLVRITDRGPFIEGRIVDLSLAAATKVDVVGPGLAQVKLEVLQTPASLQQGGRWAVQIGAFEDETGAAKLQSRLERRYHTAKVLKFASPIGDWWVRVRVLKDDRGRAEEVAHDTRTEEGAIFLVRLD